MKKLFLTAAALLTAVSVAGPVTVKAEETDKDDSAEAIMADRDEKMYRLYNPNTGEHFFTSDAEERDKTIAAGWNYEGVGWYAPVKSDTPVYRLYNRNGGEHHYTDDKAEKDMLVSAGWEYEGIGWYSDDGKMVAVYREYNPNAYSNNHNYSSDEEEKEELIEDGWEDEGVGWYGVDDAVVNSDKAKMVEYAKTFIGMPYAWGGSSPEGFDCSGFVDYIFEKTGLDTNMLDLKKGIRLSTYTMNDYLLEQVKKSSTDIVWETFDTEDDSDIRLGDVVLYADSKKDAEKGNFYHVGIGVADGQVISAVNEETGVAISPVEAGYMRIFRMKNK